MQVLRTLATVAVAAALLAAFVSFGHLMPWHGEKPSQDPPPIAAGGTDASSLDEPGRPRPGAVALDAPPPTMQPTPAKACGDDCRRDGDDRRGDDEDDEDDKDEGPRKKGKDKSPRDG